MEGYIYILSNSAMPGMVKIGFTERDNINARIAELSSATGVPLPFELEYACQIPNVRKVERALHMAFSRDRVHPRKEFFEIDVMQAQAILELFDVFDITSEVLLKNEEEADVDDKEAVKRLKRKRRPVINFLEIGLEVGDVITFIPSQTGDSPPVQACIYSGRQIEYNGEVTYLTVLTKELLERDYNVQPGPYWTSAKGYIADLYDRCYGS